MQMARTQKLHERLDQLEEEFAVFLGKELERVAQGHSSRFLSRKVPHLVDGRFYRTAEVADAERTEQEILDLRQKLKEADSEGLLTILEHYVEAERQLKDRFDGGDKRLARTTLTKLKEWQSEHAPVRGVGEVTGQ